jgi:hypothetical protein
MWYNISTVKEKRYKKMARFSIIVINFNKWYSGRDGGYPEQFERIAEADTKAEAINIVAAAYAMDGYEVQTHNIIDIGEFADRDEWWEAEYKIIKEAEEKKKAEAKARKEAREEAEAKAMGMAVEEYRNKKKNEAKARKVRREIEELKQEIARKEAYLAKLEA